MRVSLHQAQADIYQNRRRSPAIASVSHHALAE
jgi:hypothetical protein